MNEQAVPTLVDRRRARLSRYAPWMLRDYVSNQGPSTAIVVALIGFLAFREFVPSTAMHDMTDADAGRFMRGLVGTFVFLGTFFATNGIVANDRKQGYYKFLFAKPVSPPWYYLLTFAMYGVGLAGIALVLLGVWALVVRPMFPVELFAVVLLMYVAYGGIGFLLSAAWRFDWLSLVTVIFVANVVWTMWGHSTSALHPLLYLLPPVHRADEVYALVANPGRRIPWHAVEWLGGYGAACLVAGLLVVRRRSLGTQ
jgi:ABC-type multidrug transport system permease subunit